MIIIFLDIDGVLNHVDTRYEDIPLRRKNGEKLQVPVDPDCMTRLNRLIAQTGASIVISSSWRLFVSLEELGSALFCCGLVAGIVGETPNLGNGRIDRGTEIAAWLARHPGVASFVILDVCSDMGNLRSLLIQTDPFVGLDDRDVDRARQLLIGEPLAAASGEELVRHARVTQRIP